MPALGMGRAPSMRNPSHEMVQRCAALFVNRDYRREMGVVSGLLSKLDWLTLQRTSESRATRTVIQNYQQTRRRLAFDIGNLLMTPAYKTRSDTATVSAFINTSTSKDLQIFLIF